MVRSSTARILGTTAVLVLLAPGGASAKTVVDSCGMVVAGTATLQGDLDCSAHPGHALVLDGRLELRGHTLTGNSTDPAGYSTIDCAGDCVISIRGPGTIVGGANGVSGGTVKVSREVTIRDAAEWGVSGARVRLRECHVLDNGFALPVGASGGGGIVGGKITVSHSRVEDNASFGMNASVRAVVNHASILQNGLVDIRSFERPRLRDANCMVSSRANLNENWGVCIND